MRHIFKKTTSALRILTGCVIPCLLAAHSAQAATLVWNGADGGNVLWSDVDNWVGPPAAAPGTGDDAVFDNAGGANDFIDLSGGVTIRNILFDASADAYTIGAGGANFQALVVNPGGAIAMSDTVANNQWIDAGVTNSGTLILGNASVSSTLTLAGTLASASLDKTGTGLVVLSGASTVSGATTVSGGTLQYSASGSTGSVMLNGGNITIDDFRTVISGSFIFSSSNSIFKTGGSGGSGVIASTGAYAFTVAAGRIATINPSATYVANVDENTPGWTISVGVGGTLNLNGSYLPQSTSSQKGLITINGGGTTNVAGILSNHYTGTNAQTDKLRIGNTSASNTVNVTGKLLSNTITLGEGAFGGNSLVATPTVAGTDADPTIRGSGSNINWVIGGASSGNSITLNAGAVMNSAKGSGTNWVALGKDVGGNNNSILVTGAGARWVGTTVKLGINGNNNSVTIASGGFSRGEKWLLGTETSAGVGFGSGNSILVTGLGSRLESESGNNGHTSVGIAANASGNSITVAGGASAQLTWSRVSFGFAIGQNNGCDNNFVRVTGASGGTPSSLVSGIGTPITLGGVNVTANSGGVDSTASGNHFDVYSGATATISQPIHLMGTNSALNLGDGIGTSTLVVGEKTGFTSGVYLQKASATLNFNGGRLRAGAAGALVSGPGTVNLNGPAIFDTGVFVNSADSVIAGTGSLSKEGNGTLVLTNSNTYTGDTTVLSGTLRLSQNSLADASTVTISGGILDLNFAGMDSVSKLFIGTEQQPAGTYGSSLSGAENVDDTHFAGSGTLTVTSGSVSAYNAWAAAKGLTNANKGYGEDPDGDGGNNLAEFAFDGDPLNGSDVGKVFALTEDSDFDGDADKELILTIAVRAGTPPFSGVISPTASHEGITYIIEGAATPGELLSDASPVLIIVNVVAPVV